MYNKELVDKWEEGKVTSLSRPNEIERKNNPKPRENGYKISISPILITFCTKACRFFPQKYGSLMNVLRIKRIQRTTSKGRKDERRTVDDIKNQACYDEEEYQKTY